MVIISVWQCTLLPLFIQVEHFVFIIHLFIYFANLLIFSTLYLVTILFGLCPFSLCIVQTMSVDFFSPFAHFVSSTALFGNGFSSAMHSTFLSHCRCWPVWSSNTWSSCQTSASLRPDFVSAAYSEQHGKMRLMGLLRPQGQRWERHRGFECSCALWESAVTFWNWWDCWGHRARGERDTEVLNAAVHYGNRLSPSETDGIVEATGPEVRETQRFWMQLCIMGISCHLLTPA